MVLGEISGHSRKTRVMKHHCRASSTNSGFALSIYRLTRLTFDNKTPESHPRLTLTLLLGCQPIIVILLSLDEGEICPIDVVVFDIGRCITNCSTTFVASLNSPLAVASSDFLSAQMVIITPASGSSTESRTRLPR